MIFNPDIISFTYSKNSGIVPNTIIELSLPDSAPYESFREIPTITNKPDWINLIVDSVERDAEDEIIKIFYKIAVAPEYANNLSEGLHSSPVSVRGRVQLTVGSTMMSGSLTANLRVIEDVQLSLSKTNFSFNYTIGGAVPAAEFLSITTTRDWTITGDQAWLQFSQLNGNGNSTISLSADVAGLAAGVYTATFIVDDGAGQKTGTVTLNIQGTGNEEDYLNVSPAVIEISENYQEDPTSEKLIRIDSSLSVNITSNVAWLALSDADFPAGLNNLDVNTINTDVLEVGVYPAQINITSSYGTQVVNLILRIVANVTSGIETGGFYFSGDRNSLFLTNATQNAEAVLDFITRATLEVKFYKKRVPYFRNSANIIIGQETDLLLRPQSLPENLITQLHVPVRPIRYDFTVFDKSLNNAAMVERKKFENILFINGKTPKTNNRLTYLPPYITAPKDGIVAFSFISETPVEEIQITGSATTNYPVESNGDQVYTVFVDLADLNLSSGNKISIAAGPVAIEVRIFAPNFLTNQLIWLNEWDCPEVLNMNGEAEMVAEDESTTVVSTRDGREYSSVIEIKDPKSFKVNTGNIHSEAEAEFLSAVVRSKRIWLQLGTQRFEVIRNFRSISFSKTRRFNTSFDLNFDSAEK